MRINTNVSALKAQEANQQVNKQLSNSLEKLSTGLRINKASDDASGMAIADKLRTQASSLGQSISNANSASALIQIADKAMSEQSNVLDTVKTKLIQAANATTSADGRKAVLKDIQKLLTQLDMIASQTNYNGISLLQAGVNDTSGASALSFQVGELAANAITSTGGASANTEHLGGGATTLTTAATGLTIDQSGSKSVNTITAGDNLLINTAAGVTGSVDVKIDGAITSVSGVTGNVTLTTTNADDIAFLDAIATADGAGGLTGSGGTYVLSGTKTASFSNHEFSGLSITTDDNDAAGAANLGITVNGAVTITNNDSGNTTGVTISATSGMTGGDLLSTLKNLNEVSLTAEVAGSYMSVVDEAITQLNTTRSDFGSTQNQLESAVRNMSTTQTNIKSAESVIRDVDYAQESANFNKQNIIAQAGTYAMSQANNVQQNILRLLQ